MIKLQNYMDDGANHQAKAVLAFMQVHDGMAQPEVARWENCREQGYVISMKNENGDQINIAFFEHRNTDSICAVEWKQNTTNAPTIDTAVFGNVYKDKFDVSHRVGYGQISEMANWIWSRLEAHLEKKEK